MLVIILIYGGKSESYSVDENTQTNVLKHIKHNWTFINGAACSTHHCTLCSLVGWTSLARRCDSHMFYASVRPSLADVPVNPVVTCTVHKHQPLQLQIMYWAREACLLCLWPIQSIFYHSCHFICSFFKLLLVFFFHLNTIIYEKRKKQANKHLHQHLIGHFIQSQCNYSVLRSCH